MKQKKEIYRTAMYLRLSKGDQDVDGFDKSESNSITNQRLIIENFIKKNPDLKLVDTYVDDGFTGTNFDRPEMKRMMADVDAGRIDCIVVKDLSRFGRERIETGTYIAKTFKAKGIRFIAINDHYDTLTADGSETHIVMPIKALTNDNFSRDISTKVRSSQEIKWEKGEFIGAFAPYGYTKATDNKNLLVPDEYAAKIVRSIFADKLDGMSANAIAQKLNDEGVLSPMEYKKKQGQKFTTGFKSGRKALWSSQTVIRILKDEVYAGVLAQGKRARVSYKVRKEIRRPKDEWVRIEDTHKAIVSRETFDSVQTMMDRDTIKASDGGTSLFAGMLFCGDCGKSMVRRVDSRNHERGAAYICSNYNRNKECSRHSISEDDLKEAVEDFLKDHINRLANARKMSQSIDFLEIGFEAAAEHDADIVKLKEEMLRCSTLKSSLYQDLKEGIINENLFNRYREEYTNREIALQDAVAEQERVIRSIYDGKIASGVQLEEIRDSMNISGLSRIALVTFIDRILVYEGMKLEIVTKYDAVIDKVERINDGINYGWKEAV